MASFRFARPRKWWLKCAAQLVLSHVPGGRSINQLWSRNRRLHSFDEYAFKQGILHVKLLKASGLSLEDRIVLEIGTGWNPVLPYIYRIAGCRKVLLCDLNRYMTLATLQTTLRHVKDNISLAAEGLGISISQANARLPENEDDAFESLLGKSGFEYHAPLDVRRTPFEDASVDFVASRAVLEHVPEGDVADVMLEMYRILKTSGAMIHTIDHSDHWQHFDTSISRINYLKFSNARWAIINSPLSYQNRLRCREHVQIIRAAGFKTLSIEAQGDEGALSDARSMPLHSRWKNMSPEEVAILTSHVVAIKQADRRTTPINGANSAFPTS